MVSAMVRASARVSDPSTSREADVESGQRADGHDQPDGETRLRDVTDCGVTILNLSRAGARVQHVVANSFRSSPGSHPTW